MLPGVAVAALLTKSEVSSFIFPLLIAILSTCLVASANYVINEWLDREFDRYHPLKNSRPSTTGRLKAKFIILEYISLCLAGLGLASQVSLEFMIFSILLLAMGIIYNIKPFRTKDRVYLDVLSESINNPLRFLLGWFVVASHSFPPSSVLLAYWTGGAFLMAVKRFAEYRFIGDPEKAGLYRKSFRYYTEEKLLVSSLFYGMCSAFFLGIFLIKYRIEFVISFPFLALLFAWYLAIGFRAKSAAQTPEKLYKEKKFVAYVILVVGVLTTLFLVDIPFISTLVESVEY
jgi:4-hydroxybenzoate polyprenyltransferase